MARQGAAQRGWARHSLAEHGLFMIKRLVRYKIYIDRARGYIGYIQFLMLAVIMAKQFGIKLGFIGSLVLVSCFFAGCLVVGYIDTKLGIREEEARNGNEQNPEIKEILKGVKEIYEKSCSHTGTR